MASTFGPPLERLKSINRFARARAACGQSNGRRLCLKRVLSKTACLPKFVKQSFQAHRLPPNRPHRPISKQKRRRRNVPRRRVRCAPQQALGSLISLDVCFGAGCRPGDLISAACPLPATGPWVRIRAHSTGSPLPNLTFLDQGQLQPGWALPDLALSNWFCAATVTQPPTIGYCHHD